MYQADLALDGVMFDVISTVSAFAHQFNLRGTRFEVETIPLASVHKDTLII